MFPAHLAGQTCAHTIAGICKPNCLKKVLVYWHKEDTTLIAENMENSCWRQPEFWWKQLDDVEFYIHDSVHRHYIQGDTKKLEILKNPTKIEEIQEKKLLTEILLLQLAF